jgi:transcriptional regulator with XRE-family HTH domain
MMDLVLKLRELRKFRGLSQADVARTSGIGVKTLSSFETGERIAAMKLAQLQQLLRVYGVTEAEFFNGAVEHLLAPWEHEGEQELETLIRTLRELPSSVRQVITEKLRLAIELACDLGHADLPPHPKNGERRRDVRMSA